MNLPGLLHQTVAVESVTWTGTTPTYSTSTPMQARIESDTTTVRSPTGDAVTCQAVAYLPPTPTVALTDRLTLADGSQPLIAQVSPQIGGDGTTHHQVVHLAPPGTDTVTITRPAQAGAWNPTTGLVDQPPPLVVWSGLCTVTAGTAATAGDNADQSTFMHGFVVYVPLHTDRVLPRDLVTVTNSTDPLMVGAGLRVESVPSGAGLFRRALVCVADLVEVDRG